MVDNLNLHQMFLGVCILASVTRPLVSELSFEDALAALSREERFLGTVSAMNSLLAKNGIYSTADFQQIFVECAAAPMQKPSRERHGKPDPPDFLGSQHLGYYQ